MGRYETLNADSQNLIDAMIPGIQQNFGIDDIIDVIPEEVRMRMWDCDRKEWVKDESEDDARHWGLQFLKDLLTISRFKKGKFDEFQAELQEKIDEHDDHPWAKLQDIKDIKEKYTPSKKLKTDTSFIRKPENSSGESSSDDSYFEELVEIEDEPGSKRRRTLKSSREKERYESRRQEKRNHRNKRLRRDPEEGWARPVKRRDGRAATDDLSLASTTTPLNEEDFDKMSMEELEATIMLNEKQVELMKARVSLAAKRREQAENIARTPRSNVGTPHSNVGTPVRDLSRSVEATYSPSPFTPINMPATPPTHVQVTPRPYMSGPKASASKTSTSKTSNSKSSTSKTMAFCVPNSPSPTETPTRGQGPRKNDLDDDYEDDDDDE